MAKIYRTDIDGLRAIAVISVILFHLGYLSNGYLGVDIFFVISGYLITGIVYNEVEENRFSVLKFYERRVRRIIPLVLFTSLITFLAGVVLMLPDDLENMCQSVVASIFSANNILMYITSSDYWAVVNDYKPLMHTWSLGIEEQFYLLYPIIFFFLRGERKKYILPLLLILSLLSLVLFLRSNDVAAKFFFLQYRFLELAIGGVSAIYFSKRQIFNKYSRSNYVLYALLVVTVFLLVFNFFESNEIKVLVTTVLTAGILILGGIHFKDNSLYRSLLSNKIFVGIGKISFSLYMWHQIVFAYVRYSMVDEFTTMYAIGLTIFIVLLSIASYYLIENPFRNRKVLKTKPVLIIVSVSLIIITGSSLYVYAVGGIIKDVPELGITKSNRPEQLNMFSKHSNINIQYNEDVRALEGPFSESNKTKILVVGDSYARDFSNIVLESSFREDVELRYAAGSSSDYKNEEIFKQADYIFFTTYAPSTKEKVMKSIGEIDFDQDKLWIVGTKDFGQSNGIFYNTKKEIDNCQEYKTYMKNGVLETNNELKTEWGDRYIDLIAPIIDSDGKVFVFTPDCKFISQDSLHLTKFGAIYFARLLDSKLREILKLA